MKILFIHFGDKESFFFLSSCFTFLKEKYPNSSLYLLVPDEMKDYIQHFAYIEPIFYEKKTFFSTRKLVKRLNAEFFDYLIDIQRDFIRVAYAIAKKVKAKKKIGYNFPNKIKPFTIPIEKKKQNHIYNYYTNALKHFKIGKSFSPSLKIDLKKSAVKEFFQKLNIGKNSILFISTSASFSGEKWDMGNWIELVKNHNLKLFDVIIDSSEFRTDEARQFLNENNIFPINLSKKEDRAYVIKQSHFVISLSNFTYLLTQFYRKAVLLLYINDLNTKLFYPLSNGSYVVTARYKSEKLQLDSVIKAFRQMIFD